MKKEMILSNSLPMIPYSEVLNSISNTFSFTMTSGVTPPYRVLTSNRLSAPQKLLCVALLYAVDGYKRGTSRRALSLVA